MSDGDTPGAVFVGRGSDYGNPYAVRRRLITRPEGEDHEHAGSAVPGRWEHVVVNLDTGEEVQAHRGRYGEPRQAAHAQAVELYETITLPARLETDPHWAEPLRGKELVCRCPEDVACHVTPLRRVANR